MKAKLHVSVAEDRVLELSIIENGKVVLTIAVAEEDMISAIAGVEHKVDCSVFPPMMSWISHSELTPEQIEQLESRWKRQMHKGYRDFVLPDGADIIVKYDGAIWHEAEKAMKDD